MSLSHFHPAVRSWFNSTFENETPVQVVAWKKIRSGKNVLIAAPTGSGKTFAAFLCAINDLVQQSEQRPLADSVQVLYISPLKALSNDIDRNLQQPLDGIDHWLLEQRGCASGIQTAVRTGDTTPGERRRMCTKPPQILVTTPESLYLLLTSDSGRSMLGGVNTVIVDEIHAVAGSKRGSHLSLSLARLDALVVTPPRRIGLSATQKPIKLIANFLTGGQACEIVDIGHQRERDLQLELPASPLTAVMTNEVWEEIYDRLEALVDEHRTTLIFVNTRRLAERLARHLAERIGEDAVTAHHGSLSREHRLQAEQCLKSGRLRALVANFNIGAVKVRYSGAFKPLQQRLVSTVMMPLLGLCPGGGGVCPSRKAKGYRAVLLYGLKLPVTRRTTGGFFSIQRKGSFENVMGEKKSGPPWWRERESAEENYRPVMKC